MWTSVNSEEDQMKDRGVHVGLATFLREVDECSQVLERCTHGLCNAKQNPNENGSAASLKCHKQWIRKTNADKHL